MRDILRKKQFKKDYKRIARTGRNTTRLFDAVTFLQAGEPLPPHYREMLRLHYLLDEPVEGPLVPYGSNLEPGDAEVFDWFLELAKAPLRRLEALGVPIYKLFGGPTRDRIRVYKHAGSPEQIKEWMDQGITAFKTGVRGGRPARIIENKAFVDSAVEHIASLREAGGPEAVIAIDFHGAISPQTAKILLPRVRL